MRSLVKKDAGMLDAFGKGASEDIRAAKAELYAQMTWDPLTAQSLNTPPQITTPMPSPPPSPKVESDPTEANAGAPRPLLCFVLFVIPTVKWGGWAKVLVQERIRLQKSMPMKLPTGMIIL